MGRTLLVATHNQGKIAQMTELLQGLKVRQKSLADIGLRLEVEETGKTFRENAVLKARGYARSSGLLTLADDSGLEVDVLRGGPGVHTARFGGSGLLPSQRYQLLLALLAGIPWEKRTARFRSVVALASPQGLIATAAGVCEGTIALEPVGERGFGYDPVFYVSEWGKTMAELPAAVKNEISHRGRALAAMMPQLRATLRESGSAT